MKVTKDMESKTMTRRQLIQSLAFAATAASATPLTRVFAMPRARAEGMGFKAVAYNHISYNVTDNAKSRDFYADLLGLKVGYDDGKTSSLECGEPATRLYVRNIKQPGTKPSIDHFALSVASYDSDAVKAELMRRGLDPKPDGKHAWSFKAPDGIQLHIAWDGDVYPGQTSPEGNFIGQVPPQPADAEKAPFKATAIGVVIRTDNFAGTRDFYMELLGMKKIYEDNDQVFLSFGPNDNNLIIRKVEGGDKPHAESFGFTVAEFNKAKAESALKSRGLEPEAYSAYGWTVQDPDGTKFYIARKGLLAYLGKDCHGSASACPAGK